MPPCEPRALHVRLQRAERVRNTSTVRAQASALASDHPVRHDIYIFIGDVPEGGACGLCLSDHCARYAGGCRVLRGDRLGNADFIAHQGERLL